MTESSETSTYEDQSLPTTDSHDTITSLKGTYKCHTNTIKMIEYPLYDVIHQ